MANEEERKKHNDNPCHDPDCEGNHVDLGCVVHIGERMCWLWKTKEGSQGFPAFLNTEDKKSTGRNSFHHAGLPILEECNGLCLPRHHGLVKVEAKTRALPTAFHLQEWERGAKDSVQPGLRPSLAFRVEAKYVAQTAKELLVVPHREDNLGRWVEVEELAPKEIEGIIDPCGEVLQKLVVGGLSQLAAGDGSTPQRKVLSPLHNRNHPVVAGTSK